MSAAAPGGPDFRHDAGQCSPPLCRAAACSCGHCFHDHAFTLTDGQRHSCTTGCGCAEFADSGLSSQALAVIGAVSEAVGIPYGASAGDGERYKEVLAARVMHLTVALDGIAAGPPAGLAWRLEHLRERLAGCPADYRTSYAEVLADLRARDWVRTGWMGIDMRLDRLGDGPPVIFETMTFPPPDADGGLDQVRYATEAAAAAGHGRVLAAVRDELGAGAHEVTTIYLAWASGSMAGREWRVCTDGEKLFSAFGPGAEALVRAAAANGGTVSYREPDGPWIEAG